MTRAAPSAARPDVKMTAPGSSLRGKVVGRRFELVERLGAGGMAEVWKAVQRPIQRLVAVKLMRAGDPELVERFRREAEIVSRLRCPHTVTLYDYGEDADLLFIAMEYLIGATLFEDVSRHRGVALDALVDVAEQVLESLDEAHRQGVVHRDLKPENVFLVAPEEKGGSPGMRSARGVFVKVLDFGLAKVLQAREGVTAAGFTVGTPGYMSPEQLVGGAVDGRSDLFSLAVVLYQALTGALPYDGHAALRGERPRPLGQVASRLPTGLVDALMRALEADPNKRPRDAREMTVMIRSAFSSPRVPAGREGAPTIRVSGAELEAAIGPLTPTESTSRAQPRALLAWSAEPESARPRMQPAIEKAVPSHRGRVERMDGAYGVASFDETKDAVECAQDLLGRAEALRRKTGPVPLVKVAVHHGYVVTRGGQVGGDSVEMLGRVLSIADRKGPYLTRGAYEEAQAALGVKGERAGVCESEIGQPVEVYRLPRRPVAPPTASPPRPNEPGSSGAPPAAMPQPVEMPPPSADPAAAVRAAARRSPWRPIAIAVVVFLIAVALGVAAAWLRTRSGALPPTSAPGAPTAVR